MRREDFRWLLVNGLIMLAIWLLEVCAALWFWWMVS